MSSHYPIISLVLGIIFIIISMVNRFILNNKPRFRVTFYVGHLLVICGIIVSGNINLGIIILCVIIFCIVSIWLFIDSRRERSKEIVH